MNNIKEKILYIALFLGIIGIAIIAVDMSGVFLQSYSAISFYLGLLGLILSIIGLKSEKKILVTISLLLSIICVFYSLFVVSV